MNLPELFISFHPLQSRAQGRPGAGWRPWSACNKKARGRTTGAAEITRPSLRDGFTDYTYSPRGPAFLSPSPARSSHRRLGISTGMPGPHDFTAVNASFVRKLSAHDDTVTSIASPAQHSWRSRSAPLWKAGTRRNLNLICPTVQGFCWRGELARQARATSWRASQRR